MIWKDCCFLERWGNEETRLAQHRLSHQASIIQSLVIPPELDTLQHWQNKRFWVSKSLCPRVKAQAHYSMLPSVPGGRWVAIGNMKYLAPLKIARGNFQFILVDKSSLQSRSWKTMRSVTVLGAAGTWSSPAEGLSVLELIWPEAWSNYHLVVLGFLPSWHYTHAFWLNNLIHLEKWEGKERLGEPPGSYSRRKAFVHPESLQGKTAEWGISSGPETSPASLKCRDGANQSARASVLYPSSSPAHRWLWMVFWTHAFLLNLWNGDVFFSLPLLAVCLLQPCLLLGAFTVHGMFAAPGARSSRFDAVLLLVVNRVCPCFNCPAFLSLRVALEEATVGPTRTLTWAWDGCWKGAERLHIASCNRVLLQSFPLSFLGN